MKRQFNRSSLLRVAVPIIAILILSIAAVASDEHRCATTTTVTSSPNPSVVGEQVTLTATVTCYVPDWELVIFYGPGGYIGSGDTVNSEVSITTVFYWRGSRVIRAKYVGDEYRKASWGKTRQYVFKQE